MLNEVWLARGGVLPGSAAMIHIYHDDGCPCETGTGGLLFCTCHVVDYEIEQIAEN